MAPKRVIEGQATKMGRTMHGIAYNPVPDEIIVGNPLAATVLVFRGGANGNEAPVRKIQGPQTRLVYPHAVNIDVKNQEILVMDRGARAVLVFPWDANGDVAPLRIIQGPKTTLQTVVGAAVDPERNLLVVSGNPAGLYIFNRTDNGDVAPRAVIAGPKTGFANFPWQVQVHQGKIYAAIENAFYRPFYANVNLRAGVSQDAEILSPWRSDRLGFIGVWKITDNGDVPPMAIIKGPASGLVHTAGVAINVKDKEIYAVDSVRNGLFTFLVPEFFKPIR
jgi:hypothetical protein